MDPISYTSTRLLLDAATPSVPPPPAPDLERRDPFTTFVFSFVESGLSSLCACRLLSLLHRRYALQRGRAEVISSRVSPERFNGSRCATISGLEVDLGRKKAEHGLGIAYPALTRRAGLSSIRDVSLPIITMVPMTTMRLSIVKGDSVYSDVVTCIHL